MRLKNDTNNFAASFNITPPYQMMVIHSSKLIYPREVYQRRVHRSQVELIATDFNEYIANEPKVSFRNGRYYVVDGQHTIEGRIYRVGRDNPAKLPGWKKYVFPIYMAYNGKGRKDALPMKF